MKNTEKTSPRVLFIIDSLVNLNPSLDTSIRWMWAYQKKNWQVFAVEIKDFILRDQKLFFDSKSVRFKGTIDSFYLDEKCTFHSEEFEHIQMRKDPPFDMEYVTALWFLRRSKARIFNDPDAILTLNEKISILDFPEASCPAVVSSSVEELFHFVENVAHGHAVIKPLNLFGGRGVEQVIFEGNKLKDSGKIIQLQKELPGYKIAQKFDKAIFEGEVRAFTVNGEVIASCLKVPKKGNFLANTRAGAVLKNYSLSPLEQTRVKSVAESLVKKGVFIVGFDLIGGFISEINLTSPRLLLENFADELPFDKSVELFIKG